MDVKPLTEPDKKGIVQGAKDGYPLEVLAWIYVQVPQTIQEIIDAARTEEEAAANEAK